MLEKNFDPHTIESKLYPEWENSGVFSPELKGHKPVFTIMMPPPNVTGSLHMGHALNHTLQDIIVRWKRMQGMDVLWLPGTDHASIATQMLVERKLEKEGISRKEIGRDEFLKHVWKWKELHGSAIVHQLRRLGVTPDWSRERFTMDDGLNLAVKEAFIGLYKKGLAFKDKRLVNWDPILQTAVSDLEVNNVETKGTMWQIRYPMENGGYITVATTRPETMLGDTGIAVHPEDERYKNLIGQYAILPFVGRKIPIVADEHSDPEKGTGCVKITPAHDFNDFEVGKRHNLPAIDILDEHACMNENTPEPFRGLDRFAARKLILEKLEADGLLVAAEEIIHSLPYSERSEVILEPRMTEQWYVDAYTLAQPAIKAVEDGRIKLVPENWENTYFQWLRNIQPWCISRQLWWGHRIPAWYGPDKHVFVADDEQEAMELAEKHYGKPVTLVQDEDVFDTWFSSALWPFSTLGWPEKTLELEKCYPGNLLITGHDIIFFWVVRMVMMGMEFMGDIPFHAVYFTALVRDEKGQKMSKTKGNVINPLEFMDLYGTDALRFSLASLAGTGRNLNFSKSQVEGYRNFATKLWNAARFCEHHQCKLDNDFNPENVQMAMNQWIVTEVQKLGQEVAKQLENYRFDDACAALYQFIWGQFCDWYVEFTKPIFFGDNDAEQRETRATAAWVLGQILHLLHPFMPYITEELWQDLSGGEKLISSAWPTYAINNAPLSYKNKDAQEGMEWVIRMISHIRALRAEMNVPGGAQIPLFYTEGNPIVSKKLNAYGDTLIKMARLSCIEEVSNATDTTAMLVDQDTYLLQIGSVINEKEESQKLLIKRQAIEKEIIQLESKLNQPDFVQKAPPAVIEKNQGRLQEARTQKQKLQDALSRLTPKD
ncbi:MAG: valine--tRNA ligase [Alphaproteobacteria bacterium]|nr:valine--tRNA ligase [Alphaproteobacteria bacterium]